MSDTSPTYRAIHLRLRRFRGPAKEQQCVTCGKQAREWCYDGNDPLELLGSIMDRSTVTRYSEDLDHYVPMCAHCHRRHDRVSDYEELQEWRRLKRDTKLTAKDFYEMVEAI